MKSLIIAMKYIIFVFLLLAIVSPGTAPNALAFTLSNNNVDAGTSIFISGANPDYLYSIFWVNGSNPRDDACAYIYGRDLTGYFVTDLDGIDQWVAGDNDLSHYGTCFVNDSGTFKIVELSDQGFAANFSDSLQTVSFVSFATIIVK